jgi:fatty acid desaturase
MAGPSVWTTLSPVTTTVAAAASAAAAVVVVVALAVVVVAAAALVAVVVAVAVVVVVVAAVDLGGTVGVVVSRARRSLSKSDMTQPHMRGSQRGLLHSSIRGLCGLSAFEL